MSKKDKNKRNDKTENYIKLKNDKKIKKSKIKQNLPLEWPPENQILLGEKGLGQVPAAELARDGRGHSRVAVGRDLLRAHLGQLLDGGQQIRALGHFSRKPGLLRLVVRDECVHKFCGFSLFFNFGRSLKEIWPIEVKSKFSQKQLKIHIKFFYDLAKNHKNQIKKFAWKVKL